MDKDAVIWRIQNYCKLRGVKPTVACEASGAGRNFIGDIRTGKKPGIDRFEMLADYLHVTDSQLLGEETKKEPDGENAVELPDPLDAQLMDLLRRADPETKSAMLVLLQQRKKDE